jgi:hypothetical protein
LRTRDEQTGQVVTAGSVKACTSSKRFAHSASVQAY